MKHHFIPAAAAMAAYFILFGAVGLASGGASAQTIPTPQAMESPMPANVMTNNPNGPNWLQAFDRHPVPSHAMHYPAMNRSMMMNRRMMMDHCMTMHRRTMRSNHMLMRHCIMMQHRMMMKHRMMMQHPLPTASPKR